MRVLVTGATGFVGAWTAKALQDAGHTTRLLVRDPTRLEPSAAAIGVDTGDQATGDIVDQLSVEAAIDGCEAIVHCAAVVATDRRRAEEMLSTNLAGARNVLGTAVRRGLDPVVHVSSIAALFRPGLEMMHADLPVGSGNDAYSLSKGQVDLYVRGLQDAGAPVVVTYPGMVLGPPAGNQFGEVAEGIETVLRLGAVPGRNAGWSVVDVRDVAAIHAAVMLPGQGPRRFMCGGFYQSTTEIAKLLTEVTGRSIRAVPIPGAALRGIGQWVDTVSRVVPIETVFTGAAMEQFTQMPPSDNSPSEKELGIKYRDVRQTVADTVAGLVACGRLTPTQGGRG